jgi:ribosomal protein S18 acetylase RimI-like enzyme
MEETLVIRTADIDDINVIGFLAHQIWPVAYRDVLSLDQLQYMLGMFYSPKALQQQILQQGHHFYIAEIDLNEVGFASYSKIDATTYKLHKIYVLPGLHGKGVGKALLEAVIEEIEKEGAEKLLLNVNRHNKAVQFYERVGFTIKNEEDIDIGNSYFMNDYVMEKLI